MVPKIAAKGASFKGAAAYYLHDKDASTSERVAWSETRNIATKNPEAAWKVMAATAMNQDRLKAEAGVKATGRKSKNAVLTYSLSWHPDEKEGLSRKEMLRAANDSLVAIGADQHQALIICHSDEPHPHVHLMVNRVSPSDGRMLSSSKEKLKLSKWAQGYEENRGKIWCEERVANNHARDVLKEFTRASKDKPRHIFEIEQKAEKAAKGIRSADKLREAERAKDALLSQKGREMHQRHGQEWKALSTAHRSRKGEIGRATREAINRTRHNIRERDRPQWREMFKRHFAEKRDFEGKERKVAGKLQNAIGAIKSMRTVRGDQDGKGRVGEAFNYLTSSKARLEQLERIQGREKREFASTQRKEIRAASAEIRTDQKQLLSQNLDRFYQERSQLKMTQGMDQAAMKAQWKQRGEERRQEWSKFQASADLRAQADRAFKRQNSADRGKDQSR